MEEYNLSIATSHTDLVMSNCLNALDSLSTYRLGENKHSVLDLVRAEVSTGATNKHELFVGLGESDALVVSNHCPRLHQLIWALSMHGVKTPKSKFLRTSNGELVVSCISKLYILNKPSKINCSNTIWENLTCNLEWRNDVTILSVPNEKFSIKGVSSGNQKSIVVRETQISDGIVMFWKTVQGSFRIEVPDYNIWIVSALTYRIVKLKLEYLPDAIKCPWLEIAMQVIRSSCAVKKC